LRLALLASFASVKLLYKENKTLKKKKAVKRYEFFKKKEGNHEH